MEKENDEKIFRKKMIGKPKRKFSRYAWWIGKKYFWRVKKIFLARIEQKICKIPCWAKVRDKKIFLKFDNFFICSTMKKTKNL